MISIKTNKLLAPSSDGIGKTLNSAKFIAKSGNNNKKYSIPIWLISAICETAVTVPPISFKAVVPTKSPPRAYIIVSHK